MKYTLNDYLPRIEDKCTRIEIYPNTGFGARLVSEYTNRRIQIKVIWELIDNSSTSIPRPENIIQVLSNYVEKENKVVLLVGLDAYLALITERDRKDFFVGLQGLLDQQKIFAHFLISNKFFYGAVGSNPKYEGAMYLVRFQGNEQETEFNITIVSAEWVQRTDSVEIPVAAMKKMGHYIPQGDYCFTISKAELPAANYGNVVVIKSANEALKKLYGIDADFEEVCADILLKECRNKNMAPIEFLMERFGGIEYISTDKAPIRLFELKNDEIWCLFIWLLKAKINRNSYLFKVLQQNITPDNFLEQYVINTAISLLNDKSAKAFSEERASVLMRLSSVEPLIAKFVLETENNNSSIQFMNCGTSAEMEGLIRRAATFDLQIDLPDVFDAVAPTIKCYIAPNYDYTNKRLTEYFTKLRRFRIKNSVDEDFVRGAYEAEVPREIKRRDQIIGSYDDGETALLVVDGLGAEYYPLLLNMAKLNNLNVLEKQIVSVNLPSSTQFNPIKWSKEHKLQPVKRADNISHEGYSKYEKCGYEENLAELFVLFRKTILTRVVTGLKDYKRVVVTADHGSSYLAVTAYRNGLTRTIPWDSPDDWRYSSLPCEKESNPDLETVYRPDTGLTYYVVRGYNRLSKAGGKLYGLHGGATLEERLVPFVVFSNEDVEETVEQPISQFEENNDFDIL